MKQLRSTASSPAECFKLSRACFGSMPSSPLQQISWREVSTAPSDPAPWLQIPSTVKQHFVANMLCRIVALKNMYTPCRQCLPRQVCSN